MPKLKRIRVVRVALEADKGTPVNTTLALLVFNPKVVPDDTSFPREYSQAFGGQGKAENGPCTATCTFQLELRPTGRMGWTRGSRPSSRVAA